MNDDNVNLHLFLTGDRLSDARQEKDFVDWNILFGDVSLSCDSVVVVLEATTLHVCGSFADSRRRRVCVMVQGGAAQGLFDVLLTRHH